MNDEYFLSLYFVDSMIDPALDTCSVRFDRMSSDHIRLLLKDAKLKFLFSKRQGPLVNKFCKWLGFPRGHASQHTVKKIRLNYHDELIVMKISQSVAMPTSYEAFCAQVRKGGIVFLKYVIHP